MKRQKGFTLIELMIVISIIGILAAIAIPSFSKYLARARLCEGYSLFVKAKENISQFYDHTGRLPVNNPEAGLPAPANIRGKYVKSLTVSNGRVTVAFNEAVSLPDDKRSVTYVPVVAKNNPTGTVFWVSGKEALEPWMAMLDNTNLANGK